MSETKDSKQVSAEDSAYSRRQMLTGIGTALTIGGLASACGNKSGPQARADETTENSKLITESMPEPGQYRPVITPGIATLPWEMDGDVKVFRLIAEPVTLQFPDMSDGMGMKDRPVYAWGYNGSVIGPTIEAVEGDRVRIIVENRLPDATTVHWHGIHLPIEMDGVSGFSQEPIPPGGFHTVEFTLMQHGTFFYHPHFMGAKQAGMGLSGFFIIHPRNPEPWMIVDRDYCYFLQMWYLRPGSPVPDQIEMGEFNYFTMNGSPAPKIVPMSARIGEKIRIRVCNLSMMSHPIHLHGHTYRISEYGAGFIRPEQQIPANTESISAAEARSFEFVAGPNPGKWLFHCHFMHHVMNDMHRSPLPGGMAHAHGMGGMHTWINVT
jgi:manganese oxidase